LTSGHLPDTITHMTSHLAAFAAARRLGTIDIIIIR
jgi:hypothetical protein